MTGTAAELAPFDRTERAEALSAFRETGWLRPLALFLATFGLWMTALAFGLWTEQWPVRLAMAIPLTLASGRLFTLAHDAGHGSYSTSAIVNGVVGRVALVPSAHVFGLWRLHHDVHHRYTNLRGRDFVWTPLSVDEYRALPQRARFLHRVYRHGSGLGLGLQYSVEIWAPRMLWPVGRTELPDRRRALADTLLLYGMLAAGATAAWWFVALVDEGRAGDVAFWLSAVGLLFLVPLVGTHWLIGFVIFLNHTHPEVRWYDDEHEWACRDVQLEGSTGLRFSRARHALLPRRIMNHTAHHLDPGVPLRNLAAAQEHLLRRFGDRVVTDEWSLRHFRTVLSRCKLYDYDTHEWLPYAAAEEST